MKNSILFVAAIVVFVSYLCIPASAKGTLSNTNPEPTEKSSVADTQIITLPEKSIGSNDAPIVIEEYASFGCSHCADFILKVLPVIESKYIETGKVKLIFKDFPLDSVSIKASAIASCMPPERYLPFAKTIYEALASGSLGKEKSMQAIEDKLVLYASLGGLDSEKARACANDKARQNAVIQSRLDAEKAYSISGTPAFVINNGKKILFGFQSVEALSAVIDQLLAN